MDMNGSNTTIKDPENMKEDGRKFTFDYSYWSHDGCKERSDGYWEADPKHANGKKFCDQKRVMDDLGAGVLKNAWEGYNSTLFAYGQTGSGKSWSMVGYGVNKGIVPMFCEQIFVGIDAKKAAGEKIEFEVSFSMLEIYNENVRDLLNPAKSRGGLRVRQHPKKGFYAEGLRVAAVSSYKEIEAKMEEGTTNRTVASTNMNATSSRAHTIVGITFVQKFKNAAGEETAKTAVVNLVDLAGSERAESTGATGDRLKEGAAINQSLSTLGNVISALADQSSGKNVKVPYRDSVLTKLLKNALGGNSKTIMIAAVSPADINYDESLGTLRYADRAKQIKTKASVNEDPTEKLIRELKEENDALKAMLEGGGAMVMMKGGDGDVDDMTDAEREAYKKQMEEEYHALVEENQREMEEMKKTFEEKLAASHSSGQSDLLEEQLKKKKTVPHISNLNFDPQLSGHIVHFAEGSRRITGKRSDDSNDIVLMGPSMQEDHATLVNEKGVLFVEPSSSSAKVTHNGVPITEKTTLKHNDRLVFGTSQMYVIINPKERDSSKKTYPDITYEMASEEIAANSGFDMKTENKSKEEMLLQEDLVEMLPAVEEANAISVELDKRKKFEVMIVSPEARGDLKGRSEVFVKTIDIDTGHEWLWPRHKFFNRKYVMQEMYQNYTEGEDWELPPEKDPFGEDPDAEVHIGSVKIWLQPLSYKIELREQLEITDFKANEVGLLNVEVIPCDAKGKEYTEQDDVFLEDPLELIGTDCNFVVKLNSARGLPNKYTAVYAKYLFYLDDEYSTTGKIDNTTNPDWIHKKVFSYNPATHELVKYLSNSGIMVQIWGRHKPPKGAKASGSTKQILQSQTSKGTIATTEKHVDADKIKLAMEVKMLQKRQEKLEQKLAWFRKMVEISDQYKKKRISLSVIKGVLEAHSQDQAEKCMALIPKEADDDDDHDNKSPKKGEKDPSSLQRRKSTGTIQTSSKSASSRTCILL
ncbi:kinesin-like protein KIF28 isoform X2 [Lineus longissimus]|uniref:kinesin-like protein KIF28 isoform X2 n=1 Tax=Lineus longissimus TaxID=88925 RepID=UPI002B4D8E87